MVTTLAACAANASETEHVPHNRLVEREEMREWPGTDCVEEPFFGVGFPASSPEHHSTLAALGTIFKRSSFQPCRKAVTRQSMSSRRFDFTRNGLKLWPGPAADFAPSVRHFSHALQQGK
jgi:hypothetical protein